MQGEFVVFAREDIGRVFNTYAEAEKVAGEFAHAHGKTMFIYQFVGGFEADSKVDVRKISPGKTVG